MTPFCQDWDRNIGLCNSLLKYIAGTPVCMHSTLLHSFGALFRERFFWKDLLLLPSKKYLYKINIFFGLVLEKKNPRNLCFTVPHSSEAQQASGLQRKAHISQWLLLAFGAWAKCHGGGITGSTTFKFIYLNHPTKQAFVTAAHQLSAQLMRFESWKT